MRALLGVAMAAQMSCFGRSPANGLYACAAGPSACPPGYHCSSDQRCWRDDPLASCTNQILDGDESDVDCGGTCPACDVGGACRADVDCSTTTCSDARCDLATAPPFWQTLPSLSRARREPVVVATSDGWVLAAGGGDGSGAALAAIESYYTPGAAQWSGFPDLKLPSRGAAGAIVDGNLCVVGGVGTEDRMQCYDYMSNAFVVQPNGIGFEVAESGFTVDGGALFVFGGQSSSGALLADAHRYVPGAGWTALPPIAPRRALAAAADADGLVYAIGGNDGAAATSRVQSYDGAASAWLDAPALPAPTERLAAVTAPDGRIYAIGGAVDGVAVATVHACTPAQRRWSAVAPLARAREDLGATVATDGRVYAVGGSGVAAALGDVEVYGPTVTLSPPQPSAGAMLMASGNNFAAHAILRVYQGASSVGAPVVATASTDDQGVLAPLSLGTVLSGTHVWTFVDQRSRYPVTMTVTVP